jgi:hypothetical protein
LAEGRLQKIRNDLQQFPSQEGNVMLFHLLVEHNKLPLLLLGSIDWILSQFVMEHVNDLSGVYEQFYDLLKPGGIMTHHVDFRAHWTAYEWNGYWTYGDWKWQLIRGKRPYFINRAPLSEHISCLIKAGFEVLDVTKIEGNSNISQDQLAFRFRNLTMEDLQTMNAMITVRKPS